MITYKKFIHFLPFLLLIFLWIGVFLYKSMTSDIGFWMISEDYNKNSVQLLTSRDNQLIRGTFTSTFDNLGIIFLHIKPMVTDDTALNFRLKEKDATEWYTSSIHDKIGLMGYEYYPFGFPQLTDSRNKIYTFELLPVSKDQQLSIEISKQSPLIMNKYLVNKSDLLSDPTLLIRFVTSKIRYSLEHTHVLKDSLFAILPLLIYLFILIDQKFFRLIALLKKTFIKERSYIYKEILRVQNRKKQKSAKRIFTFIVLEHMKFIVFFAFFILFITLCIKAFIASLGFNADFESWRIVASIVMDNDPIYSNTARYNYGPVWGYITGGLGFIHELLGYTKAQYDPFHVIIAVFLGIVDIGVSLFVYKIYGKLPALLTLFSPILFIVSAAHSQFDNLAILFAFAGWFLFLKSQKSSSNRVYFISALLLGVSLMTKHILLFFPLWIFFIRDEQNRSYKHKMLFCGIMYIVFFCGFVFEILRFYDQRQEIIDGIVKNVFMYRGYGGSAVGTLTSLLFPKALLDGLQYIPVLKGSNFLYILFLSVYGYVASRLHFELKYYLPLYLLVFFAFAPSEAPQYLIIPLVAVSIYHRHIGALLFLIASFIYASLNYFNDIVILLSRPIDLGLTHLPFIINPWIIAGTSFEQLHSLYTISQFWLIILAISILFQKFLFGSIKVYKTGIVSYYQHHSSKVFIFILIYFNSLLLWYLILKI